MTEGKVFHGTEYRGEWKFVDEDWSKWTPRQCVGHWLRTWGDVKQVLRWIPAWNVDDAQLDKALHDLDAWLQASSPAKRPT